MADNRLKIKAMANFNSGMGWYSADNQGNIANTPENAATMKGQEPNQRRKHVKVGKSIVRIKGM